MDKLVKKIEEEFKLIAYFKQCPDAGINIDINVKDKNPQIYTFEQANGTTISFSSIVVDKNGKENLVSYSPASGIAKNVIKGFYLALFDKESKGHPGLTEKHFIEDQLEIINSWSEEVKKEYKYIIRPFIDYFEERQKIVLENFTQKNIRSTNTNEEQKLFDSEDDRIESSKSKEEITNHFSVLLQKYKGKQVMTNEQVTTFLESNFKCFANRKERNLIKPNCTQNSLMYLIYKLYNNRQDNTVAQDYTNLLINNFEQFKNKTHDYIIKEWSKPNGNIFKIK